MALLTNGNKGRGEKDNSAKKQNTRAMSQPRQNTQQKSFR